MCLLELTQKKVLDPIVNLWYYKHQVSTVKIFKLDILIVLYKVVTTFSKTCMI